MNVTCPNCATIYRVDPAKVPEAGVRARCNVCSAVFAVRREPEATPGQPVVKAAAPVQPARPEPPRPESPRPEPPPVQQPRPEPPRAAVPGAAPRPPGAASPAAPSGLPPRPAAPQRPVGPAAPTGSSAGVSAAAAPAAAPRAPAPAAPPASPKPPMAPPASAPAGAAPLRSAPGGAGRPTNPFLSQDPALKARRLARALISDMVVYHPGKRQEGLRDGNLKELFEEEIKKSWEEYAEQVGREVAESTAYFREALNEILAGGRQIF